MFVFGGQVGDLNELGHDVVLASVSVQHAEEHRLHPRFHASLACHCRDALLLFKVRHHGLQHLSQEETPSKTQLRVVVARPHHKHHICRQGCSLGQAQQH